MAARCHDFAKGEVLEGEFARAKDQCVIAAKGNYLQAAMTSAEFAYRKAVMRDTWGHLAPAHNARYHGWVEWSRSTFGNTHIHDFELCSKTMGYLESSPWLFDFLQGIQAEHLSGPVLPPGIYRFEGCLTNYTLVGKIFLAYHGWALPTSGARTTGLKRNANEQQLLPHPTPRRPSADR